MDAIPEGQEDDDNRSRSWSDDEPLSDDEERDEVLADELKAV
tara:strand:+ start:80 stop:205 length:126 start_codon:yes stop_codon:yes gene_type:complete